MRPIPDLKTGGDAGLVIGALGVVFGDIGTSPLYAVKVAFGEPQGSLPAADDVVGCCP